MNDCHIIYKKDIRKWMRRGVACAGVSLVSAAAALTALAALCAPARVPPTLIAAVGALALGLFAAAALAGGRCLVKYRRYRRYFEATGLTRCSEENVKRWLETRDVTK